MNATRRLHKRRSCWPKYNPNELVVRLKVDVSGFVAGTKRVSNELQFLNRPARAKQRYADRMAGNRRKWEIQ